MKCSSVITNVKTDLEVKSNESNVVSVADDHSNSTERFVDVLIFRIATGAMVCNYSIPLVNQHEVSHLDSWLAQAWRRAVSEGLAKPEDREMYRLELQGNLSVNEAIDRAQEINGQLVHVRGGLLLDFERQVLVHFPANERQNWVDPSPTTGHHKLSGSVIWVNIALLGTRQELSNWKGRWVSLYGVIHAIDLPDMREHWYARLRNWWKYGSAHPQVGLGHWSAYAVAIDVLEMTDLQTTEGLDSDGRPKERTRGPRTSRSDTEQRSQSRVGQGKGAATPALLGKTIRKVLLEEFDIAREAIKLNGWSVLALLVFINLVVKVVSKM